MARNKRKSKATSAAPATTTSTSVTSTALPATDTHTNPNFERRTNTILKLKVPSIGSHPSTPRDSAGEKDKSDGDDFAKDYAAREDHLSDEELYLICKYQALLVLALHETKPFVYLDHSNIMRELDDFNSGYLNEDGLEMQHAKFRDEATIEKFLGMRSYVAAKLANRIEDLANANYRDEPKNRFIDGKNPEHASFTRIIISAKQFKDWCTIIKNPRYKGILEYPEKSEPVLKHLRKVVDEQYDYKMWHRFPPEPKFNQVPRLIGEGMHEELQYTAMHPYKIFGVIDITIPGTDRRFFQMDVFDDMPKPMKVKRNQSWHPEVFYLPCPDAFIIPKPLTSPRWAGKANWVLADWNPKLWIRADGKQWLVRFGTRMFDEKTKEYIEFCHPDPAWLANVDPNDEEWRRKYNDFFHKLGGLWSEDEAEGEEGEEGEGEEDSDVDGEDVQGEEAENEDVEGEEAEDEDVEVDVEDEV